MLLQEFLDKNEKQLKRKGAEVFQHESRTDRENHLVLDVIFRDDLKKKALENGWKKVNTAGPVTIKAKEEASEEPKTEESQVEDKPKTRRAKK